MIVERITVGPLQTNCYVVADELNGKGVIIDPGGDAGKILRVVDKLGVKISLVINTHGHFDHIMANKNIIEATGASLAIHKEDENLLRKGGGLLFLGLIASSPPPDLYLQEGDVVKIGKAYLRVLHTPGHSPGSISLYSPEENILFSGDVLFYMGIGRWDFPGGDYHVLMDSIQNKLLTLPDETIVYPGHGPSTTIGQEKTHNPFLVNL
ncbi:MAG: MBL fold metallo-hydrolase [Anaerolineae bacterium]|nr:MBL fold metallo-hydrolase [Anaerolineae bacterium]MDW8101360.1 MBL fold metallo-hydrolase [Anaerolineae bacterium]